MLGKALHGPPMIAIVVLTMTTEKSNISLSCAGSSLPVLAPDGGSESPPGTTSFGLGASRPSHLRSLVHYLKKAEWVTLAK